MEQYKHTNTLYHAGVKGMKWGVRRYQNKDGTLTEAGKRRYAKDTAGMNEKTKKKYVADPEKWVTEDVERTKRVADAGRNLTETLGNASRRSSGSKSTKMDLSKMTDQEMRNRINRELLERQYNDMFAPQKVSKGKEFVSKLMSGLTTTLGVTASALGVALAIRDLTGRGK